MRWNLSKPETLLVATCAALFALACFGPFVGQAANYHSFADQRELGGVPFAMDVLSNLPFALAGIAGVVALWRTPDHSLGNVTRAMAGLFFGGLIMTAAASSWYHWRPDDAGLAVDRIGMAIAFAGLLGLAAATRISDRAGPALGLVLLVTAPLAVHAWSVTGNLLPWVVLQSGGMLFVLAAAVMPRKSAALDIRWAWVIFAYGIAKLLEANDHEVYRLTGEIISGHTLKHVVAAFAACPVIAALRAPSISKQNESGAASGFRRIKRMSTRRAGSF